MDTKGNNRNGGNRQAQLARWIKSGWRSQEADVFRRRHLSCNNGKYTILLYTLGFALLGKEGSIKKGLAKLEKRVNRNGDPFEATADFFGVSKEVMKRIGDLEGPYGRMAPTEIAKMLERGKLSDGETVIVSRGSHGKHIP